MNKCKLIVEHEATITGYTDKFIAQTSKLRTEYTFKNEKVVQDIVNLLDTICDDNRCYFIPKERNDD